MKLLLLIFLSMLARGLAAAQSPPVGIIDFYGLRSVPEQRVRQALQIKEGDSLPASREESQRRLEATAERSASASQCRLLRSGQDHSLRGNQRKGFTFVAISFGAQRRYSFA